MYKVYRVYHPCRLYTLDTSTVPRYNYIGHCMELKGIAYVQTLKLCKYSAGARLFRTQPGTVEYHQVLGTSPMMQSIAEGKKVVASSTGTLKYSKCMCSAAIKKVTTFPWL